MAFATQTRRVLCETSHRSAQRVTLIRLRQLYATRTTTSGNNDNNDKVFETRQQHRHWHMATCSTPPLPSNINSTSKSIYYNKVDKHDYEQHRQWYSTNATTSTKIDTSTSASNDDNIANGESGRKHFKDIFIDGAVRDKRTLRGEQEKKGLMPDADPSEASTVAARIRRQLQMQSKQRLGGREELETHDLPTRRPTDLRHQTKDLSRLDSSVVAKILRDRVIYDKGDIVAIDKPYGLPVHGGPGMGHSIASLLPQLSRRLGKRPGETGPPDLHLIHRLDKETTGVMLLARTELTARILHEMFRKRRMVKRYLVITVGVPSPLEGIIDMPMAEAEIDGKHRMVVKTDASDLLPQSWAARKGQGRQRSNRDAQQAVTKYKVLSKSDQCALVQLEPETGVKHQIRVHLAQGLGCPILGDHKYSHHNKLAPQKLPGSMLQVLGITQPKARTVPMHLHARQLVIPETFNQQNIFISTRVPWHFSHNMKKLKLKYEP